MSLNFQRSGWWLAAIVVCVWFAEPAASDACCSVASAGKFVVNADQRVIILWDPVAKRQHFIRQASFQTDDKNVGFIVPTPNEPELDEAGDSAFTTLMNLTAPEVRYVGGRRPCSIGCSAVPPPTAAVGSVEVLQEKRVAGFDTVVLSADSAEALTEWLKDHDFAMTDAVQKWAEPYIAQKWKFTAMKVAPVDEPDANETIESPGAAQEIEAAALRISFDTDAPLFPYREPESDAAANELHVQSRTLQIYFISDARYEGSFRDAPLEPWTGKAEWSKPLEPFTRMSLLSTLKLPEDSGPQTWWLTEFTDDWKYRQAPGDVYFESASTQTTLERPAIIRDLSQRESNHGTGVVLTFALACALPWICRRACRFPLSS